MKKLFGGIDLTWKKLIIFAIAAGIVTAVIALIPALEYTSLHAIAETFEVWIFIGIFIIMNSKSNKDSALKCFVFFLISQPLVYLIQVPFSPMGFGLFTYYKYWAIWTVLCLPMGYIGYYMKKNKWWGYLILLSMILFTGYSYYGDLRTMMFSFPLYILMSLFCIFAMVLYPLVVFDNQKIRKVGAAISVVLVIAASVLAFMNPIVYSTEILGEDQYKFDDSYSVELANPKMGDVSIVDLDGYYMVHGDFNKRGSTDLIVTSPNGDKKAFPLHVEEYTFELGEAK